MTDDPIDGWYLCELLGHRTIAGFVTERPVGSVVMLRIDVPEVDGAAAWTQLFNASSVYAMTPVSETDALSLVRRYRPRSPAVFALPAPSMHDDEEDDADRVDREYAGSAHRDDEYGDDDDDDPIQF